MGERIGWDKFETVLLIDACERVAQGGVKQEIVKELSKVLRSRAIFQGNKVDELFRNENGIALQMTKMNYILTNGKNGLPGASKFFAEMVALKRTSPEEYALILREAKQQIEGEGSGNSAVDNKRSEFIKWLGNQGKLKVHPNSIISVLDESSLYAKKHGVSKISFWDMEDSTTFISAYRKLTGNKLFRVFKKTLAQTLDKVFVYYKEFLDSLVVESKDETVSEKTAKEASKEVDTISDSTNIKPLHTIDNLETGFVEWLQNKGMAEATVRSYASSIRSAETYAKENNIDGINLITNDIEQILSSIDILLANKMFIEHNQQQHNRFSAAFRKMRDYIAEIDRREAQRTSDLELEVKNPTLYHKLYSVSKVYDDPQGLSVEHILSMIDHICSKAELVEFLDRTSWATKLSDEVYSFEKKLLLVKEQPINEILEKKEPSDFNKESFVRVLMSRYQSGMQFDSIDMENFRDTYEDMFDEKLDFTDEELEVRLKYCGIFYKDRLFPAEGIIDNATRERLFAYIDSNFATGNKILYYKAIFADLADDFAYCFSLTDEQMLKAYIEYTTEKGKYYFQSDFMSVDKDVKIDNSKEIVDFMLSAGKPLSYDDIYEGLSHISKDIIYGEIRTNSKFLMNGRENYFHIDIFEFSTSDDDKISDLLNKEIEENGYAIWSKVFVSVQEQMPIFLENNLYLSPLGIRNAISRYMENKFDFDGEVISTYGARLGMADVFRLFAKHNTPFSDEDLYNFAQQTDTTIYFWALAEESVRVSKNLFVAKDQIDFDVEATDKALETYLSSGYILVKDVDSFLVFPNVGYEWNEYLLESYLLHYSKKFCLVNNGISLNNVAGAIADKNGKFTEFVDVCAQALADSGIELKKTVALNYLAEINLITRKSYKDLDTAMTKARQIRNQKG